MQVSERLYECVTHEAQLCWIRKALQRGEVVTDIGLWLGGVNRPEALIKLLANKGMKICETTKEVKDAADEKHKARA